LTTDLCDVIFLSFKLSINYLTANVKLSERKEGQKEKKSRIRYRKPVFAGWKATKRTGSRDSAKWIKYLQKLRRHGQRFLEL